MSADVQVVELTKRFPSSAGYRDMLMPWRRQFKTALHCVNLRIERGEVFGLLGPNGAGKTTLMKVLAGLVLPDSGHALVRGYDVARYPEKTKAFLGYMIGDERSFYWRLTGRQNLRFFALLNDLPRREIGPRVHQLLSLVGLIDAADERVMTYSSGMKQRLIIARGLLADPAILLLDEPTRSLDPLGARHLWELIKGELIGRLGKTIVIATHNMEEATYLCDRVAVLHQGQVKACGTVAELRDTLTGLERCSISVCDISHDALAQVSSLHGVQTVSMIAPNGHREYLLELTVEDPTVQVPAVIDLLVGAGGRVLQVTRQPRPLSEVIAALTEAS